MGNETLTAAEQQAEKTRKADLAAAIERKDDVELRLFATQIGVADVDKIKDRKDLVAAVELQDEANAEAGRQKIRDMEADQAKAVAEENDKRPPAARIIRALNAEFCRELPQEARSGSFEPEDDDARFGGDYDVPNGKYRVTGSEWLFLIAKKRLVSVERATEANKWGGKAVIPVD